MQTIILASDNPGKIRELKSLLTGTEFNIVPQSELGAASPKETGLTFIENALLKARHASTVTGLPALADDSGLSVEALGGAPGIYSARFSGEHASDPENIEKLLIELKDVPQWKRQAAFHCVLAYLRHPADPIPLIFHGVWSGEITNFPAAEGGFGYDPVFYVPECGKTAAEMTKTDKNMLSHRGQAMRMLLNALVHG